MQESELVEQLKKVVDNVTVNNEGISSNNEGIVFCVPITGYRPVAVIERRAKRVKKKLRSLLIKLFKEKEKIIVSVTYVEKVLQNLDLARRLLALCCYLKIWKIDEVSLTSQRPQQTKTVQSIGILNNSFENIKVKFAYA